MIIEPPAPPMIEFDAATANADAISVDRLNGEVIVLTDTLECPCMARESSPIYAEPVPQPPECAVPEPQVGNVEAGEEEQEGARTEDEADGDDNFEDVGTAMEQHTRLRQLIKQHRQRLRKPKSVIGDQKTAGLLMDLEALSKFNDQHFELMVKVEKRNADLTQAKGKKRRLLQMKKKRIRPSFDASSKVAYHCGKGPYYARRLRQMSLHLLRTGDLLIDKQGQGANHATLLDCPEVAGPIGKWLKGLIPEDKGGLKGNVSGVIFSLMFKVLPFG